MHKKTHKINAKIIVAIMWKKVTKRLLYILIKINILYSFIFFVSTIRG